MDNSGTLLWEKNIGGSLSEYGESIGITTDGGYIVASEAYSNDGDVSGNHGNSDFWAVKLATDPLTVSDFILQPISLHPNPAKDYITLQLPNDSGYFVQITNNLGQNLYEAELYNQKNDIQLPSGMGAGLYFVSLTNTLTHGVETIKLLVE